MVALADAISAPQTGLLRDFSFEITAKDANVLVSLRPLIPAGTMVSITYLLTETDEARVAAARAVRQAGFTPLPHVAARRIASPGELRRFIDAMVGEADVDRLFIIAGDVPTPAGPFADSLAVIEQAPLRALGIRSVGIGGYPEGHPGIAPDTLERAMVAKLRALAEQGLGAEIMTQFAFDSDAMVAWVARLRTRGIHNRIRLGLPGPANVGTLAAVCTAMRCRRIGEGYDTLRRIDHQAALDGGTGPALSGPRQPACAGDSRRCGHPYVSVRRPAENGRMDPRERRELTRLSLQTERTHMTLPLQTYRMTLSCPDRPGLVAAASGALFALGANILEAQHFAGQRSGLFFMRLVFESALPEPDLRNGLARLEVDGMALCLRSTRDRQRILILVSKFDHCLVDLLYRDRIGELDAEIIGIVSNHSKGALQTWLPEHVPFHHFPVLPSAKAAQEAQIKQLVTESRADLIVLARYMQILSDDLAGFLSGRCINIHHSFLPGFKGARPYHQAYDRGVKMIGATAHYVTSDLDEGPIIRQELERVTHADTPEDMIRKGRDVERRVLARAVSDHLQMRVLLDGHRTVVFAD